jgi:hypothetical protein
VERVLLASLMDVDDTVLATDVSPSALALTLDDAESPTNLRGPRAPHGDPSDTRPSGGGKGVVVTLGRFVDSKLVVAVSLFGLHVLVCER